MTRRLPGAAGGALSSLREAARRTVGLARFLNQPLDPAEIEPIMRRRMAEREANFLATVRDGILANPSNPMGQLMRMADIGFEDVEARVRESGIDGALEELREGGVYITLDEFKGRKPLERHGRRVDFRPGDLARRHSEGQFHVATGGSSGRPAKVPLGYGYLEQYTVNVALTVEVGAGLDTPLIMWFPVYPSPAGLLTTLMLARAGAAPVSWFAQTLETTRTSGLTTWATLGIARLLGNRVPFPRGSALNAPDPVLDAIRDRLDRGGRCVLYTYVSSAVRVCRLAADRGIRLDGLTVLCSSEPITAARRQLMESTGARVVPMYWITEVGLVGAACPDGCPEADEVHVYQDSVAVIRAGDASGSGPGDGALYFTPLLDTFSTAYLNLELGDRARLESRPCGCLLGQLGLSQRVVHVRSASRLTLGGMSLAATDLFDLVERVLPERHGGVAGDYQVVEEWSEDDADLVIRVRPGDGALDEAAVRRSFLDALGERHPLEARMLADSDAVRVVERQPHVTDGGKIHPVAVVR